MSGGGGRGTRLEGEMGGFIGQWWGGGDLSLIWVVTIITFSIREKQVGGCAVVNRWESSINKTGLWGGGDGSMSMSPV